MTRMAAPGDCRTALRMAWRDLAMAVDVTQQVLMTARSACCGVATRTHPARRRSSATAFPSYWLTLHPSVVSENRCIPSPPRLPNSVGSPGTSPRRKGCSWGDEIIHNTLRKAAPTWDGPETFGAGVARDGQLLANALRLRRRRIVRRSHTED